MDNPRDWREEKTRYIQLLEESTGEGLDAWNQRVMSEGPHDEPSLRAWLSQQGVSGYAQTLLVMERFGYPDFFLATAGELIEAQYADRPQLRPIYEAILQAALAFGEVTVQARKTYVSLLTPRRTFARVQPATKNRLILGLRLDGHKPGGRLEPSNIQDTMKLQISFSSPDELDAEALGYLRLAYDQNSRSQPAKSKEQSHDTG